MKGNKIALLVVPAAAVVAIGLVTLRLHFQPPTVPVFAISGDHGEVTLRPQSTFELDIRPEAPVTGAIGARGFLLRDDHVYPWDPAYSVQRDGSIQIAGPVATLFHGVAPGAWEAAVAVGRPEELPTSPFDVLRGRNQNDTALGWRLVRQRIRLLPDAQDAGSR